MYVEFIFNEGLPEKQGNYLFCFDDSDVRSGFYNADVNATDKRITVINDDAEEAFITIEAVKGYLTNSSFLVKDIKDYPEIIEELERRYYQDQQLRKAVEEKIAYFEAELELRIWTSDQYRNEQMRKSGKVKELAESQEYAELQGELEKAQYRENSRLIRLGRHKRAFSVVKLELRQAIVRKGEF